LARQLAVAVSRGEDFLGRHTKKGRVLFWQSEDSPEDAKEDFQKQEAPDNKDIAILHSEANDTASRENELRDVLTNADDEGKPFDLVIIETMGDFLQPENENSNGELANLLIGFSERVVRKFQGTAFLLLHHFNKSTDAAVQNNAILRVSGAKAITAKTDAKWFLYQLSDNDPQRVFATKVRKGEDIEPTYLDFDKLTDNATLSEKVKDLQQTAREAEKLTKAIQLESNIISIVQKAPAISKTILMHTLGGRASVAKAHIDKLIEQGQLKTLKNGKVIHCFTADQEPSVEACKSWGNVVGEDAA
jgi:hypothetical protein